MTTQQIVRGISFEPEVYEALERLRGNRQHFRSPYINKLLRRELIEKTDPGKVV